MKIILLGFICLNWKERVMLFSALVISVGLAYLAARSDKGIISNDGMGPLVLFALCFYSMIIIGIVRLRSLALNKIFVDTLKELHIARAKLGEDEPRKIMHDLARFLGDKE